MGRRANPASPHPHAGSRVAQPLARWCWSGQREEPVLFCFHIGVTSFPFDLGRLPYKAKRPMKDMIGLYRNRQSSSGGYPAGEGLTGSAEQPQPVAVSEAQSQQDELVQLREELSSQKVPPGPALPLATQTLFVRQPIATLTRCLCFSLRGAGRSVGLHACLGQVLQR